MKWAVIGHNIFEERYSLLGNFLKEQGLANELTFVEADQDEFPNKLKELMNDPGLRIRIESPYREVTLNHFKGLPMLVAGIGATDCLVRRESAWWPDTILYYAFNRLFSMHGAALDLKGEILVVGGGAATRFAIAAALRAGFSKINISTKYDDQGLSLVSDLKRRYFGVTFEFVPQDRLVLLPGINVLLINTSPLAPTNDLLDELYYLNFLRQDGMIWDLVVNPGLTQLIREGEQINIKCVRGREVAAIADHLWVSITSPVAVPDFKLLLELYERTFSGEQPGTDEKSRTLA